MKKIIINTLVTASLLAGSALIAQETPKGWFPAGSHPKDYLMSLDTNTVHAGKASACVQSRTPEPTGFGTLMQTCSADTFRGQRVRLSAYLRASQVKDWAGLWMRVDGPKGEPLAFDNMQDRPIKNTSEWTKHEIVLDVPGDSQQVAFGLLLTGAGQVWIDDLNFEIVGKDVPTTGSGPTKRVPAAPVNLDFEE